MIFFVLLSFAVQVSSQSPNLNVVVFGRARFVLFSSALIRIQLVDSNRSDFDLRPSLAMPFSADPTKPVEHKTEVSGDILTITTSALHLIFNKSYETFGVDALNITLLNVFPQVQC